jgi:hypothetical protein
MSAAEIAAAPIVGEHDCLAPDFGFAKGRKENGVADRSSSMTARTIPKGRRRGRHVRSSLRSVDFDRINRAAIAVLPSLLARWLPGGRMEGSEYVPLNPRRVDRNRGSFKVNLRSGRWSDFACDHAAGGDPISLAAYLSGLSQIDAAKRLAVMLGVGGCDGD